MSAAEVSRRVEAACDYFFATFKEAGGYADSRIGYAEHYNNMADEILLMASERHGISMAYLKKIIKGQIERTNERVTNNGDRHAVTTAGNEATSQGLRPEGQGRSFEWLC